MKVLIVSDTHGREDNLEKVLEKESPIDAMVHLGDVEGSEDYIRILTDAPVYMVAGNNDFYTDLPGQAVIDLDGYRAFITHGHGYHVSYSPNRLVAEALHRNAQIAMYGHTHVPHLEQVEGVIVLNFARDVLVDSEAMVDALVAGKVKHYVTDFPTPEIAGVKGAIVIPHLGASTEESEDNCAKMAVKEVMDYLENGNIRHSVNYPDCDMGLRGDKTRILVLHHNVPNMIGQISAVLAKDNMNIADLTNKSKGKYAYTMIDVDSEVQEGVVEELKQIGEVLRVRVIC